MSVPNVVKIQVYAALNNKYAKMNLTAANTYKKLCEDAIAFDKELFDIYNNDMPGVGDKWKGMQSSNQNNPDQNGPGYHFGMTGWQTTTGKLPALKTVNASGSSGLNVLVENITGSMTTAYTSGTASLPAFTSVNKEAYTIELANTGSSSYDYTASASADWIKLSKTSGSVNTIANIEVSVDWSKVTGNVSGTVTVSDGSNSVDVNVSAEVIDTTGLSDKTYVMANGYATIDVSNYSAIKNGSGFNNRNEFVSNNMVVVPDNGKYMSSVRTSSSTVTYMDESELAEAPYVEYKVYVPYDGTYNIQSQFNPTSNVEYGKKELRYGISVDGGDITITNSIGSDYLAGAYSGTWTRDIEKNGRSSVVSNVSLKAGTHTIRYYQCDPNMALIRMTVYEDSLANVYNSPAESYYVGKEVNTDARISDKNTMYSRIGD